MAQPVPRTVGWSHGRARPATTGPSSTHHSATPPHSKVGDKHKRGWSAGSHGNICGKGHQGLSWAPAAIPSARLERVGPWHYQNDKEPPDKSSAFHYSLHRACSHTPLGKQLRLQESNWETLPVSEINAQFLQMHIYSN